MPYQGNAMNERILNHDALAELCRGYWYPAYALVRHLGNDADSSQDLTQGFFAIVDAADYERLARHK